MDLVPAVLGFFVPRSYFKGSLQIFILKLLSTIARYCVSSFIYVAALGGVLMLGRSFYMCDT